MTGLVRMLHDPTTGLVTLAKDSRGFIALDGGLETPVFQSLFSDRRARPADREEDKRGWWGDDHARVDGDQIGSHLWLLRRQPLSAETIRRAQLYAEEALRWLQTDGLAKTIEVTAQRVDDAIQLTVAITRPDGTQWSSVWDQHGERVD